MAQNIPWTWADAIAEEKNSMPIEKDEMQLMRFEHGIRGITFGWCDKNGNIQWKKKCSSEMCTEENELVII